ncbi:MAG: PqqD family protein [Clostridia bacterium]|nr:PqqD family protein [Clostridia bacterium]
MKIRSGFILRDVAGKTYVVATGALSKEFNGMITLNEMGKFIWLLLQNDISRDEIVEKIMQECIDDVDRKVVESDVDDFLAQLKKDNILE